MRPTIRMTDCSASGITQRFGRRSPPRLPFLLAAPLGHPAGGIGTAAKAGYPGPIAPAGLDEHRLGARAAPAVAPAALAQGRVRQLAVAARAVAGAGFDERDAVGAVAQLAALRGMGSSVHPFGRELNL